MISLEKAKILALRALRKYGLRGRKGRHFEIGTHRDGLPFVRLKSGEVTPLKGSFENEQDYMQLAHEFVIDPDTYFIEQESKVPWSSKTLRQHWYDTLDPQEAREMQEAFLSLRDAGMWAYEIKPEDITKAFEGWLRTVRLSEL